MGLYISLGSRIHKKTAFHALSWEDVVQQIFGDIDKKYTI